MTWAAGDVDVAIIGAGQAGLAVGYYLARSGVDFLLLERTDQIGTSWARRWDSLRLFTPAHHDALPGLAFPGEPWAYPGKDDVAAYLAEYATHHRQPVRTGARVVRLAGQSGAFDLQLADGEAITARRVVVATGAFGTPFTPAWAGRLDPHVLQVHTDALSRAGFSGGSELTSRLWLGR